MLRIYESADPNTAFTDSANMTNPFRLSFDGRTGGVSEARCYLRNDSSSYTYTSITITPVDLSAALKSKVDGTDGYSWKLKAGDTQPLEEEWATISPANTISMADISNTTTYLPFWVRVEVPRGAPVESIDFVVLRVSRNETHV